jgi:molecular chaperone GrpE (heat shock protein)
MLKKCAILGVVVVSLGGIALAWGHYRMQTQRPQVNRQGPPKGSLRSQDYISKYGRWYEITPDEQTKLVLELDTDRRTKTPQQLADEQRDRLQADVDKLAAGEMVPSEIVTYLYGPDWQQEVTRYKEQMEQARSIQAAAVISVSFGAGLFVLSILAAIVRLFIRALRNIRARKADDADPQPATSSIQTQAEDVTVSAIDTDQMSPESDEISNLEPQISEPQAESKPRKRAQRPSVAVEPVADTPWAQEPVCVMDRTFDMPGTTTEAASPVAVQTLRDHAEDLQRQIAAFNSAAESAQQATVEKAAPLNNTLKELTEQVSAIRDYAASQQDQMRKLQDGYDWGIIRTFCLRVIRCIDNIDGRVQEVASAGESSELLEEIRDELLFALESSGVEQFEPEFGSEYRGQEKYAEAVKEKEPSGRPDQTGTIAKVLRPGYRYVMDEENFKVVRTAQVMLFGCEDE